MGLVGSLRSLAVHYLPKYAVPEQVIRISESARQILVGHVAATIFVLSQLYGSRQFLAAVPWGIVMLLGTIPTLRLLNKLSDEAMENAAEVAAKTAVIAGLRGMLWLVGIIGLLPSVDEHMAYVLEFTMLAMLIGGIVNYWALPLAALTYSTMITLGSVIAIYSINDRPIDDAIAILIVGAYLYFNRMGLTNARNMRSGFEALRHLKDEQEVVSLLLREFEEGARDWLWKADKTGNLIRGVDGFAVALGGGSEAFRVAPMIDVLQKMAKDKEQRYGVTALGFRLAGGAAFTDCEITVGSGDKTVYLSLTAKPDFDAYGNRLGWHGVCANISEARKAEAHVRRMASLDALTGLPNRGRLREKLDQLINRGDGVVRHVAYGDLDGFKNVNDVKGHATGDAVLRALACRFSALLKPAEMVARIGGDEFVFVLERDEAQTDFTWREIVKQASEPVVVEGQPQYVGISLGIVALENDVSHVDEILRRADLALYKAKQQGRSTARYYTKEMDDVLAERRELEIALRAAVAGKHFEMYYQPIFACRAMQLRGYEALIRWNDKIHGDVSPSVFIPLAEECGLISEIGAWTLRQACLDARKFGPGISVSVNISALQMRSRRLLVDVTQALAASGLSPHLLELEMTETALADNTGLPENLTTELKALGVHLALDDFGTGYSSLSYLHRFKFDRIKIDRSFVQAYDTREVSRAVVDAILALAQQLNISVTAEGVETQAQFELMAIKGMDCAQGFLLGIPQPIDMVIAGSNRLAGAA